MENNEQKFDWNFKPSADRHLIANSTTIEGKKVINLTPDFDRRLALVDLQVLNRLTEHLPVQDIAYFKINLKKNITNSHSLKEMVEICEDFVAFHKTVNLIQEVCLNCPEEFADQDIEEDEQECGLTVDKPKKKEKVRMDKM